MLAIEIALYTYAIGIKYQLFNKKMNKNGLGLNLN